MWLKYLGSACDLGLEYYVCHLMRHVPSIGFELFGQVPIILAVSVIFPNPTFYRHLSYNVNVIV